MNSYSTLITRCFTLLISALLLTGSLQAAGAPHATKTILIWGDSLSAGYGIPANKSWAALLEKRLQENRRTHSVINGSISGETTQGGATRLAAAIDRHRPDILILELGGNDGLRGIRLEAMETNLRKMLSLATSHDMKILILGMKIPPNYGPRYTQGFERVYQALSKEFETGLVPFFLQGIATNYKLMQADGIHPNERAQPGLLENVWGALEKML